MKISTYELIEEMIDLNGETAELAQLLKDLFPVDYQRLRVLWAAFRDHKCYFDTFNRADLADLLDTFEPTNDLEDDVADFLELMIDAHGYIECLEAEMSDDDHRIGAAALAVEHAITELMN
jgi:hypothetical protein